MFLVARSADEDALHPRIADSCILTVAPIRFYEPILEGEFSEVCQERRSRRRVGRSVTLAVGILLVGTGSPFLSGPWTTVGLPGGTGEAGSPGAPLSV